MGGKTATSTQQVGIPPSVLAQYQTVNAQAGQTAQTPFQQYGGQFVAPVNSQQQAGISGVNAGANVAQPYYGQATGDINQTQANTTPVNNAATGLAAASAGAVDPSQIDASSINQYLNPYLGDVLGSTSALLNQNNQQQQSGQLGTAISSGAFGGDRTGIAAANLEQQQNLANANIYSGIADTGFNTALSTAQQQQGVGLAAGQANRSALASAGQELSGIGATQYGEGANTATTLAGLGTGAQSAALSGAQAQIGAGTVQQQTQQAQDTAEYNQFLQQQSYPFQVDQFLANIAEGTGALSGSTTTTQQPGGFFSDKRLKHDIKKIGKTYDGQDLYSYKMHGDSRTHVGLIAQEVEKKHPRAVGVASGYKFVDYGKATEKAANRGHFASGGGGWHEGVKAYTDHTGNARTVVKMPGSAEREAAGFKARYGTMRENNAPSPEMTARRTGLAAGGVSGGGRVWQPAAYAVGGSPSIVSAADMDAILQAQQGMYAPMSGGAGVYGGTSTGVPRGGSSRVPAPSGATPHLVTAQGGLRAQPSALENAKSMSDLGTSAAKFYGAYRKDHPNQDTPPPTADAAPAPAATPGDTPMARGGGVVARRGFDTGGSPDGSGGLDAILAAQARMYQGQHQNRDVPNQPGGGHELAVANGSPNAAPSGASNVNNVIGLGQKGYQAYHHFSQPSTSPGSGGPTASQAAAEGPAAPGAGVSPAATDAAASEGPAASASGVAAPAATDAAVSTAAPVAADAAGTAGGAAAGAAGAGAVDAGAADAAAALAAEYAAGDAAVALAAAKRGGRIRQKFDAGGTPYEATPTGDPYSDSGGQMGIPDTQNSTKLQTAGPLKKQPTGLQTLETLGTQEGAQGAISGMFSNSALARGGGVAARRKGYDTGGSPDDADPAADPDIINPQGVAKGVINRNPKKADLMYSRDAGSVIPYAAPKAPAPQREDPVDPEVASYTTGNYGPDADYKYTPPGTKLTTRGASGSYGSGVAPSLGVPSAVAATPPPTPAPSGLGAGADQGPPSNLQAPPPAYTGGVGLSPTPPPDVQPPAKVGVDKPTWWDKIKGSELAKPENLIPLLTAIGAMGTAPTRSLGVAAASGLTAGAQSYLPTRQEMADIQQTGAQTGRIGVETQGKQIQNLAELQQQYALKGFALYPDPNGPIQGPNGQRYVAKSKASSLGTNQTGSQPPAQYNYLGKNGVQSAQGEGVRYSTLPDATQAESSKQIGETYEAGNAAQSRMPSIQRWEQTVAANPNGILAPGAMHDLRTDAVNMWNSGMDQVGHPEYKVDGLEDAQMAEKTSKGNAAAAEAAGQQRSFNALKAFLQQTPNPTMQRGAALSLISDMHMENQQAIDKKNYLDEFDKENQRQFGAPIPRNYLASNALQSFDKDYPTNNYQGERNHLSNILQSPGFAKLSGDLQNAPADKKAKLLKALDDKYGPNFHRYFTGS